MRVFGVDIQGALVRSDLSQANKNPSQLSNAVPNALLVKQMTDWAMGGWVPSIISGDLNADMRLYVELWLAQSGVPYSNCLLGVTNMSDALKWTGCAFFVTNDLEKVLPAVEENPELRVYIFNSIKTIEQQKKLFKSGLGQKVIDRIKFVRNTNDIAAKESQIA